ncbi:Translation initiation factor IF-2 [Penicillium cosmopolitanum]|uniref:Translation initiation factor IF-2, mitochondrial n=1 Tax=Penicillium cosmopolitanum TaxID=1131564 RepID=A0A9W9W8Q0_9EURO|nr:Translation initiation factor IF-2 [Penicillium cosmopolitanum]KAJ5408485.1 Translation initiation factor IF-2 [Penicillium cosmopolitanum]
MHRRAVLRFPRRVDLYSTPSRSFRSSAIRSNSAGSGSGDGDGTASSSSAPVPKFGNRWGPKLVTKPTGLSAAEQTLRDSLKAASQPPPKPEQPKHRPRERRPFERHPGATRNGPGDHSLRSHDKPTSFRRDRVRERHEREQNGQLPRNQRQSQERRDNDWTCKSCNGHVFAKHVACPFCSAPRPDVARRREPHTFWKDRTPAGRKGLGKDTSPDATAMKYRGLKDELEESNADEKEQQQQPLDAVSEAEAKLERQKRKEERLKAKEDQWNWDMSALEKLEAKEALEQAASSKKSGRKGQRPSQSEGDDFDPEEHERLREERKRLKKAKADKKKGRSAKVEAAPTPIYLPEFISVSNLADVVGVRPNLFVQRMEEMGFEDVMYNHVLDAETAGLVAAEYNFEALFDTENPDLQAAPVPEDPSLLPSRPPVVTIMGHVDHGKTTILDWLRKSSVAATEHGGITQHIGAFSVPMPSGKTITFLDTPGHSAFLEMRRRGADVTDIVVLVVAADDSVKPQTIEAIKHATQANVPIIVAMSKIDKEGRDPDRVKQDLSVHGVHVEDYGGDVQAIGVSGKTGEGMIELEEAIGALSEMLDHRADTAGNAEGWVLEATTKSYGRVASALIRRGTLRTGDVIVAGETWARVRTLRNEAGLSIEEATPGMPVEIDGWRDQPAAGTEILQAPTEQRAKEVVEYRQDRSDNKKLGEDMEAINVARREAMEKRRLEDMDSDEAATKAAEPTGPKPVNFIVKADVDGSAEAVLNSIAAIGNNEIYANVIRSGVGPVGEFDIEHAASANGIVISFNMPIDNNMMRMAEMEGVQIMDHNIIYKLIDDVKANLSEHLEPTVTQRVTGEAEIGQIFEITLKGREKTAIAGCRVRNGMVQKSRKVRVTRNDETIFDGTMNSLKNVKKDVTEMRKDTECGIGFEGWTDFAVGDHVQCYEEIFEKRYL